MRKYFTWELGRVALAFSEPLFFTSESLLALEPGAQRGVLYSVACVDALLLLTAVRTLPVLLCTNAVRQTSQYQALTRHTAIADNR